LTSTRHCNINAFMGKVLLVSDSRQTRRRAKSDFLSDFLSVSVETEKQEIEPRLAAGGLYRDGERARPVLRRFKEIRTELDALCQTWPEEQARLERASQHHI
jgi:hypothetical protein